MSSKGKTKGSKLTKKARKLASAYIAEEINTRKYPRSQAIAIGLSRARTESHRQATLSKITRLLKKYR